MKALMCLFVIACVGVTGYHYATAVPPAHAVLVFDVSLSVTKNCAGLENAAAELIADKAMQRGSTVTVFQMGSGVNDPEPRRVFDQAVPFPPDTVYGRNTKAFEKARQEFFANIRNACDSAPTTARSPIARSIERGVEHLRSRGCTAVSGCQLLVKTDGEEDVDKALSRVVAQATKDANVAVPAELGGRFDNAGIRVGLCGVAETSPRPKGAKAPPSPETLARIWKGLFKNPEIVSVRPFCGAATESVR